MATDRAAALDSATRLIVGIESARQTAREAQDSGADSIGADAYMVSKSLVELLSDPPKAGPVINITVNGAELLPLEFAAVFSRELAAMLGPPDSSEPPKTGRTQLTIDGGEDPVKRDDDPKRAEEQAVSIDMWEPSGANWDALPYDRAWATAELAAFREEHRGTTAKRPSTMFRGWLAKRPGAAEHKRG